MDPGFFAHPDPDFKNPVMDFKNQDPDPSIFGLNYSKSFNN